ncbi:cell division protein FtsZ [Algivirga pacifica]|uniref:Cell division protein FtsZ n=1 Tax=Algivirga pacifica TaxID=1162670 RepID=A0ABP9D5F9_9BACT
MDTNYEFDIPAGASNIIKVFGVGGGGGNAVKHMYELGITDVDFFICNTDIQALQASPVPNKVQIGTELTEGLGAGAKPEVGKQAALESKEEITNILQNNTKMLFITAGMGGGTGTGAAPVIAEIAKELDILTVGIVTMPFKFEGKPKERRALEGIEELKKNCDTVLVILNDRLKEVYGRSTMKEAFGQADNVLTKGAKSIAEIITEDGYINVDFEDVNTVMRHSGQAVMGSATESGEDRAIRAAEGAITSPLLNNTNINNAQNILLSIVVSDYDEFGMEELEQITDYIQEQAGGQAEVIFGVASDPSLGDAISVTVIATGFETDGEEETRTVIDLHSGKANKETKPAPGYTTKGEDFFKEGESREQGVSEVKTEAASEENKVQTEEAPVEKEIEEEKAPQQAAPSPQKPKKRVFTLDDNYDVMDEQEIIEDEPSMEEPEDDTLQGRHQISRYMKASSVSEWSNEELKEKQETPAFIRRGVKLKDIPHSSESEQSRFNVSDKKKIMGDNSFLHDNVD